MSRTKGDFLSYARNSIKQSTSSTVSRGLDGSKEYYPDNHGGDETTRGYVYQANAGSYSSNSISSGTAEAVQRENVSSDGYDEDDDGGIYSESGSSGGTSNSTSFFDLPVRNVDREPYTIAESVPGSSTGTGRVSRTRTTLLDKVGKAFGNQLQKKPKDKEKVFTAVKRSVLTIAEAKNNRAKLIKLLMQTCDQLDYGISAVTRGHKDVTIWSNLEYVDAEIIIDAVLVSAQKSAVAADAVRKVLVYAEKVQLGVILIPRLYKTVTYMIKTGLHIQLM